MSSVTVQCRSRNCLARHRLRWRLWVKMRHGALTIIDAGAVGRNHKRAGIERRYARRPRGGGGR